MQVFLGIDWSHTHHEACFINARGQVLSRLTVEHTAAGLAELDQARARLGVARDECWVALETAHTLLIDFLWDQGYPLVFVTPALALRASAVQVFHRAQSKAPAGGTGKPMLTRTKVTPGSSPTWSALTPPRSTPGDPMA